MTHLDPSGNSNDSTDGAGGRRHRARHDGAAPEPYIPPVGDETLVFDQPLRTTEPSGGARRSRAERRRAEAAGARATDNGVRAEAAGTRAAENNGVRVERAGARTGALPGFSGGVNGAGTGTLDMTAAGAVAGAGGVAAGPTPADRSGPAGATSGAGGATGGRSPGRAGRNLPAAIGVGVGLGLLVLGSLLFWRPAFLAVIIAAAGGAVWEMTRAVRPSGARPPLAPLLAGGFSIVWLAWFGGPDALAVGLLLSVLAVMIWRLPDGPAGFQRDLGAAALIIVYVPFLAGFAALLAVPEHDGHLRILVTLAAVVLSDTGGYVAGVFFGKHPMAPTISPKKSWEGLAGSLIATAGGSALLLSLLLDVAPWWGALFGLVLSGAAVLGDLTESMIKRDLGIKDMSTLLPGHGGLMDRLDSILFALPAAYILLSWLAPVSG